jgi:hypothetical protein
VRVEADQLAYTSLLTNAPRLGGRVPCARATLGCLAEH